MHDDLGIEPRRVSTAVPIGAGVVTAVVGFTSTFAVVLTGLRAVGASPAQAASGLLAVCVLQGLCSMVLALRARIPVTFAWSTPGAALLVSAGSVSGGWPAAVGAFTVTGVAIVATGFVPLLADAVGRIPMAVAQAMLAGVLLPLCLAPVPALAGHPWAILPVLIVWLVVNRWSARWAVPAAFAAAVVVIAVDLVRRGTGPPVASLIPHLTWTTPHLSVQAVTGIAIPLYIVTMAAQNIPGVAVMATFGYRVPWRSAMTASGVSTVVGAGFGVHAVNLAAISATLAAGPGAHPDPARRWLAAVTTGPAYLIIGAASTAVAAVVATAPDGVVATVAGLALLATLAAALGAALGTAAPGEARPTHQTLAVAATFVVAASGESVLGISSAFWALVAGIVVWVAMRPRAGAAVLGDGSVRR